MNPSQRPLARRKANSFAELSKEDRKIFMKESAIVAIEEGMDYLQAGRKVAIQRQLVHIQKHEEKAVKQAIFRVAKSMQQLQEMTSNVEVDGSNHGADAVEPNGASNESECIDVLDNNRLDKCGRKRKKLHMLVPGDKKRAAMMYKGASNHMEYRRAVKEAIHQVVSNDVARSSNSLAKKAILNLQAKGIHLGVRRCTELVNICKEHGKVPSPQKPGGVFVPACIEERIVSLIKGLRQRKLPVFGDDVIGWCTELIKDTPCATRFRDGKASEGWYRGFLRRTGMTTGTERPLEITRAEWYNEKNLTTYYDVAEGVLVNAGVATKNPHYNPNDPYSQSIFITRPERIVSFDETRLELDCTRTSKAKTDRMVRDGLEDRGETLAVKSSCTASAVCGRTGTGMLVLNAMVCKLPCIVMLCILTCSALQVWHSHLTLCLARGRPSITPGLLSTRLM